MAFIEHLLFFCVFAVALAYLAVNAFALKAARRFSQYQPVDQFQRVYSDFAMPVSLLLAVHNGEERVVSAVRSLLQMHYSDYEVLVINDDSTDGTLDKLIEAFELSRASEVNEQRLETQPVRGVYRSRTHANLRVIDKEQGRKADALNAGLVWSRSPLFCCVDQEAILDATGLHRIVQPFVEDASLVACGGSIRIANGSILEGGYLKRAGLPTDPLVVFQVVQYLRDFLIGRLGWSSRNALLALSGTFNVFRKEAVLAAGGFRVDARGAETEMVLRLHRTLQTAGQDYRIAFVPAPICWVQAPENLSSIKTQYVQRYQELIHGMLLNRGLLFGKNGGAVGWLAFPFAILFEWLTPLLVLTGSVLMIAGLCFGLIPWQAPVLLALTALCLGIAQSLNAVLVEEISFPIAAERSQVLRLMAFAVLENLGYRQLTGLWRLEAIIHGPRDRRGS